MESTNSSSVIKPSPEHPLPIPVPDWLRARHVWKSCWPAHVYGFGCAFLLAAVLCLGSPPCHVICRYCRRSARSSPATLTVSGIVGLVCLSQSCVLLIDAYHSTGRLPVPVVQMVHGLVFPGIVATLTILDRVFSALVKPRQHLGSIKHPRLVATALFIYLLSTSVTYLVIAVRPEARLWLLLSQAVSLVWGCAAVFLVVCQCLRLGRYARVTARSRRQAVLYVRAKRHVDSAHDSQRRCELLQHLAKLRVARTRADEFVQQTLSALDEPGDPHLDTSSTDSEDRQLPSGVEVTKTTTVKLNHIRYRRRSRRRRHGIGSRTTYGGSDAVRDFTVTALAAARLLWSPSPDSDGRSDASSSWQVYLHPTRDRGNFHRHKTHNSTICGDRKQQESRRSITATESRDEIDDGVEETTESSSRTDKTIAEIHAVSDNACRNIDENEPGCDCASSAGSGLFRHQQQSGQATMPAAQDEEQQRRVSSAVDASSRTCLLLDSSDGSRLTSTAARLLHRAAVQWRRSRKVSSRPVDVARSSRVVGDDQGHVTLGRSRDVRSTLSERQQCRSDDAVTYDNPAYDECDDVTRCSDAGNALFVGRVTSLQYQAEVDTECRYVPSGYLADTELDNVELRHDPDVRTLPGIALPPVTSSYGAYLGLSRLRGGRTVRIVWRTASVAVTSACVVCTLHIYSMLGVFGVLSNHRPASAWPWLAFQTLYRLSELVCFYALLAVTWSLQWRQLRPHRPHVTQSHDLVTSSPSSAPHHAVESA